jgi:hypothetical protein
MAAVASAVVFFTKCYLTEASIVSRIKERAQERPGHALADSIIREAMAYSFPRIGVFRHGEQVGQETSRRRLMIREP